MSGDSPNVPVSNEYNGHNQAMKDIKEFLDGMPVFNERNFSSFNADINQNTFRRLPLYLSTTEQGSDSQHIKTDKIALNRPYIHLYEANNKQNTKDMNKEEENLEEGLPDKNNHPE